MDPKNKNKSSCEKEKKGKNKNAAATMDSLSVDLEKARTAIQTNTVLQLKDVLNTLSISYPIRKWMFNEAFYSDISSLWYDGVQKFHVDMVRYLIEEYEFIPSLDRIQQGLIFVLENRAKDSKWSILVSLLENLRESYYLNEAMIAALTEVRMVIITNLLQLKGINFWYIQYRSETFMVLIRTNASYLMNLLLHDRRCDIHCLYFNYLMMAATNGAKDIIPLVLQWYSRNRIDIEEETLRSMFHVAVVNGHLSVVMYLSRYYYKFIRSGVLFTSFMMASDMIQQHDDEKTRRIIQVLMWLLSIEPQDNEYIGYTTIRNSLRSSLTRTEMAEMIAGTYGNEDEQPNNKQESIHDDRYMLLSGFKRGEECFICREMRNDKNMNNFKSCMNVIKQHRYCLACVCNMPRERNVDNGDLYVKCYCGSPIDVQPMDCFLYDKSKDVVALVSHMNIEEEEEKQPSSPKTKKRK
jgi:hypothetical protein